MRVTSESGAQWQMVHSGSSYASQSELTLTFGLATDEQVLMLEMNWPSGALQTFEEVGRNQVSYQRGRGTDVCSVTISWILRSACDRRCGLSHEFFLDQPSKEFKWW